jgi:glycosyltransferase involved in cell wall biosynthesis
MRVALLVPEFNWPGDAVGNDVHGMYVTLLKAGVECAVFTAVPHRHPGIRSGAFADVAGWLSAKDLLIYHYASGGRAALEIARSIVCPTIVRYHNVTPSHFFDGISTEYARTAMEGRELLGDFARLPKAAAFSASWYSSRELVAAGLPARRSFVVPPFHMVNQLAQQAATSYKYNGDGCFTFLYVGRCSPNKRIDLLLETFAELRSRTARPVRLVVVGSRDPRLQLYSTRIDQMVATRRLGQIIEFQSELSPDDLAARYANADAFVTCSEHEGFCVAAVEAMALGVPVVAPNSCALPETCGDAALLCSSKEEFVSAFQRLLSDEALRSRLSAAGRRRYARYFTEPKISLKFLRMLYKVDYPLVGDLVGFLSWFGSSLSSSTV